MKFADAIKATLFAIRAKPGELGLRPHTLERVVRYADGNPRSTVSEDRQPITQANGEPVRLRWLTDEELTVGGLSQGTCEAPNITPSDGTIGYTADFLRGDNLQPGDQLYYRITGPRHPVGALYQVSQLKTEKSMHFVLRLKPVEQQLYE